MYKSIINILQVDAELWTTGSQVTLWEEVEILILSQAHPNPDIKLSFTDK